MDVVRLKHAAEVGLVGLALAQALERGVLVPEGLKERIGELRRVERPLRQRRNGFFDFDRVHSVSPLSVVSTRKGCDLDLVRSPHDLGQLKIELPKQPFAR